MVFHLIDGDYEFPEIKTELPTDSVLLASGLIHLDEINKNKQIQYSSKKKEDGKVDRCTKHLIEGDDLTYLHGLTESIQHITEDSLNRHEIRNEDNFLVNETMPDGREYDWLLTNSNDEVKFHAEFQNGTENWEHIDQTTFKVLSSISPYNVLVVDTISKTGKRKKWKSVLDKSNINSVVYLVTLQDFLNGRINKFKRIR